MAPLFEESAPQTCDYADRQPETAEDAPGQTTTLSRFAEFATGISRGGLRTGHIAPMQAKPPCPPTYLGWSIALTILCCSPGDSGSACGVHPGEPLLPEGRLKAARTASQWAVWLVMASIALDCSLDDDGHVLLRKYPKTIATERLPESGSRSVAMEDE